MNHQLWQRGQRVVVTLRSGRKLRGFVAQDQCAGSRYVLVAYIDPKGRRGLQRTSLFFEVHRVRASRRKKPVPEWSQQELDARFPSSTWGREAPPDSDFYRGGFSVGGMYASLGDEMHAFSLRPRKP